MKVGGEYGIGWTNRRMRKRRMMVNILKKKIEI